MKIISHRGNIRGVVSEKENRPSYIDCAIQLGYDVEVDIRFINGEFWLGHDEPQYRVELTWMELRKKNIWFHCKNIQSASELIRLNSNFMFFCHTHDDFVIVNGDKLWVHDLSKKLDKNCIIPLLGLDECNHYQKYDVYGVCTDYPSAIKESEKINNLTYFSNKENYV